MKKLLILMLLGVLFVPTGGSAKADEMRYCMDELATALGKQNDSQEGRCVKNFYERDI